MATSTVGSTPGHYHWALSTPAVQSWIAQSAGNWGLLLRQQSEGQGTLSRYSSGEATDVSRRPRLTVTYTDPAALQVDRTDSYQPVLSGLVSGTGTYDQVSFTVTRPAGVGGGSFPSTPVSRVAGQRAAYTVPRSTPTFQGVVAGKTYTWTMKQCKAGVCTTSAVQSFTVDPLIAAGDRGFFSYRDWTLSDRVKLKVNASTGNLLAEMSDLSVPGINGDTTLGRTYNSLALAPGSQSSSGTAGPGWSTAVGTDTRVVLRRDGSATVYLPSGYAALFVPKATGGFTGPPGINATLSRPDAKWRYADHGSGATWDFDAAGRLLTIKDRSKNTTWIRRDGSGNVSAVDGSRGGPDPRAEAKSVGRVVSCGLVWGRRGGWDGCGRVASMVVPTPSVEPRATSVDVIFSGVGSVCPAWRA